jgi:hypothetical protein
MGSGKSGWRWRRLGRRATVRRMDPPPVRVTDETLLRARRNPSKVAAWVLRSIIDELIDRRFTDPSWGGSDG